MAPRPLQKLIIVVPAFNEAERIGETVAALRNAGPALAETCADVRVYVVDDGSSDHTAEIARERGADRVIGHKVNQGLGAAIRTGLLAARRDEADVVVKFDADLQHDPADIAALVKPLVDDEADVVYGNRFERIEYRMPWVRRIGNRTFTWLMRMLTGWPVRDGQPGIFAIHRDYLQVFHLPGDYNYTQQILLDAYHKGMRFAHVPVSFRRRTTGRSFVSLKYPFKVLYQILFVLVSLKPMRVFGTLGLLFLLAGTAVFTTELTLYFQGALRKPVEHVNLVMGLALFGLQTVFFGLLAELIVKTTRGR